MKLSNGTRVHHSNCLWSYGFTEGDCADRPSWGWGTVVESVPQRDGTYEYRVRMDAPLFEGGDTLTWWPSYLVDDVRSPTSEPKDVA